MQYASEIAPLRARMMHLLKQSDSAMPSNDEQPRQYADIHHNDCVITGSNVTIVDSFGHGVSWAAEKRHLSAREATVAGIKIDCMERLRDGRYYADWAQRQFGTACLGDLDDAQLARVETYVRNATPK